MSDSQTAAAPPITRGNLVAGLRGLTDAAFAIPSGRLRRIVAERAGVRLQIEFTDPELAELYAQRLGATAAAEREAPDIRIRVLESVRLPELPTPEWGDERLPPRDFWTAVSSVGLHAVYPHHPGLWQIWNPAQRLGVQLAHDRATLPPWDGGAPLRVFFHWILRERGLRLTHAATVGLNDVGVLVVGSGGAGKSATALAAVAHGLQTAGDDYVALEAGDPPTAHALYRIVKQDRRGLARLGGLAERTAGLADNWQGKIELDPAQFFPGCFTERIRIRAVLVPEIARAAATTIVPIGPGEALRWLMPSNLFQLAGEPDPGMAFYADLLRQLPCHRIRLSDNPQEIAGRLRAFITELRP